MGGILAVRDGEEFSLFRLSRPKARDNMSPRSWVWGNRMVESDDEIYVYDGVNQSEEKVQVSRILRHNREPVLLDRRTISTCLQNDAMAMQLSEECLDIIEQARHEDSPDMKVNLEADSESSDDDSEVRERSREASRLAAEGQLPRNRRVRTLTEKGHFFHGL